MAICRDVSDLPITRINNSEIRPIKSAEGDLAPRLVQGARFQPARRGMTSDGAEKPVFPRRRGKTSFGAPKPVARKNCDIYICCMIMCDHPNTSFLALVIVCDTPTASM